MSIPQNEKIKCTVDYIRRKKLHTKVMELMTPNSRAQKTRGAMMMQDTNVSKLDTQIQRLKKQGYLPDDAKRLHTSKQERNRSIYQGN